MGGAIRKFFIFLSLITAVLVPFSTAAAAGLSVKYHKEVLDNGATVICSDMPDSRLVAIQIRVLSGLSNEGKYAGSGISHFLEHLLFKGTKDLSAEEIRANIKRMGGIFNGSTGLDSAEYHIIVPNDKFEDALDLLADVVMTPVFTDEQVATEKDIIRKEINMREDDPSQERITLLFSNAYTENVYKNPIIGYEDVLGDLTPGDILDYHSMVYTPERIVVGVAGGVDPERAMGAVRRKFSAYKRGFNWQAENAREPSQLKRRDLVVEEDIGLGYLSIGFHTTSLYSRDLYAVDVLAIILGGGTDSRLYRTLVKQDQALYTVDSLNYTPKYPGLFIISAAGEPHALVPARKAILSVIGEIAAGGVSTEELERARNIVLSEYFHSHEQALSIVSSLTSSELFVGDPSFFEKYVQEISAVNAEDVKKAARKYLTETNSTSIYMVPRGMKEKIEDDLAVSAGGEQRKPEAREGSGEVSSMVTLDNGLRVIVKRRTATPLVSATYVAPGGVRAETPATNGISNLTSLLMTKGTSRRKESQIVPAIEMMGGVLATFSGMNSMGLNLDIMSGDYREAMDIFQDVLMNASFGEDEITKAKRMVQAAIRQQDVDIFDNGVTRLMRLIYGDHPYSMRLLGEPGTVDGMNREQIVKFYKERIAPEGAVICVVGDVDVDSTIEDLSRRFGHWKGRSGGKIPEKEVRPIPKGAAEDIIMDKGQALLLLGFRNGRLDEESRYPLAVAASVLSGGDGLLYRMAREEEGLAYASGAISVPQVETGYFIVYIATTEENLERAGETALEALAMVSGGDIEEEDVAAAINTLLSQHAQSLETNSAQSLTMALDELYGLGYMNYLSVPGRIKGVTVEAVTQAARQTFDPDHAAKLIVHSRADYR